MSAPLSPESLTSERLAHHKHDTPSGFQNPWPSLTTITKAVVTAMKIPITRATPFGDGDIVQEVKVVKPDWSLCAPEAALGRICATWTGHAGYFVCLPCGDRPVNILFDPIFSERASPSTYFGPRRRLPPPCTVENLPQIDYVALSHNHYDHTDGDALQRIWKRADSSEVQTPKFLVPLGVKDVLVGLGLPERAVYELDWWDSMSFNLGGDGTADETKVDFICVPAQHNSGRGILDQNATLWSGWVVRTSTPDPSISPSIYFAGDTGYQTADGPCPAFKEIGDKYGPFDLAMIPIWRGASLSFLGRLNLRLSDDTLLATLHALPEDAVQLASDVKAHHSLAMHFATFAGSKDEALEPIVRLKRARKCDWMEEGGFGWIDMGEMVTIPVVGKGL